MFNQILDIVGKIVLPISPFLKEYNFLFMAALIFNIENKLDGFEFNYENKDKILN